MKYLNSICPGKARSPFHHLSNPLESTGESTAQRELLQLKHSQEQPIIITVKEGGAGAKALTHSADYGGDTMTAIWTEHTQFALTCCSLNLPSPSETSPPPAFRTGLTGYSGIYPSNAA